MEEVTNLCSQVSLREKEVAGLVIKVEEENRS